MRKLTVALLSVVIAFLIVVQYVKTPTAIQESQYDGIPWETLSYSEPSGILIFSSTDSIPWEITDEKTLNWFYENFDNLEISYKEEPTSDENDAFRNDKALYVLIECKDAGLSLMVNTDKKLLLVSENTTMSSENIKSPPAGIYSVQSEFDFDSFWNAYRKQRVPEST